MIAAVKYDKWIILSLFIASLLLKDFLACLFVLLLIFSLLLYDKKLLKHFSNSGFLLFLFITIIIPAIAYPTIQKISENTLIVSRGLLFIFTLYFLLNDIESSRLYPYLLKILPEELKLSVNIAFKLCPDIKEVFEKCWQNIKVAKKVNFSILLQLFDDLIHLAEQLRYDFIRHEPGIVYIVTGKIHEGKSSLALNIANILKNRDFKVGGIISKSINKDNKRSGYDVIDLKSGQMYPLATTDSIDNYCEVCGQFYFYRNGMDFANQSLSLDCLKDIDFVFVDELGKLELNEKGFFKSIIELINAKKHTIILVMRNEYIDAAKKKFNFEPKNIIQVRDTSNS